MFRRGVGPGTPSGRGLTLLFLLTVAVPAVFLVVVSLSLIEEEPLEKAETTSLDRIATTLEEQILALLDQTRDTMLYRDWDRTLDVPASWLEMLATDPCPLLLGMDGGVVWPVFPDITLTESPHHLSPEIVSDLEAISADLLALTDADLAARIRELRAQDSGRALRAALLRLEATHASIHSRTERGRRKWMQLLRYYAELLDAEGQSYATVCFENLSRLPGCEPQPLAEWWGGALLSGCYRLPPPEEELAWQKLLTYCKTAAPELAPGVLAARKQRNRWREQARTLGDEVPGERFSGDDAQIALQLGAGPDSDQLVLVQSVRVEAEDLLAALVLTATQAGELVNSALTEVARFNDAAYVEVTSPAGQVYRTAGGVVPVVRERLLEQLGTGWSAGLALRHTRLLREQARRNREGAAAIAGIATLVLLGGVLLVLRGVRRNIQVTRSKSDFVSAVSHELRTPLANIRLYAELLQMNVQKTAEERATAYDVIANETERLSRLIEGVLSYSRLERGKHVFHPERVDLQQLVQETIERFKQGLDLDWEVTFEVDGHPRAVVTDRDAIGQALENLLSNARKYGGEARTIAVRLRYTSRRAEIAVTDKGIGIARKDRRAVFEKFHRVEAELTRKTSGTGLGLALAQDLVKGCRGKLSVRSKLGEGSTFTISLPLRRRQWSRSS